jgi:predicted Zn-dependent protease
VDPAVSDSHEGTRVSLLHEWGHYLTGREHSSEPSDVMYERFGDALNLSDADVARLDWPSRRISEGYF